MAPHEKISRDIDDLKAELIDLLRKKYVLHQFIDLETEILEEKILKLLEEVDELNKNKKPAMNNQSLSMKLGQSINRLQCCRLLLSMDGIVSHMSSDSSQNMYTETVDGYFVFKDLLQKVFNLFGSKEMALEEFSVMSCVMSCCGDTLFEVVHKLKKVFSEHIYWSGTSGELKWRVGVEGEETSTDQSTWILALKTLDRLNELEPILTQLFDELLTYFIDPILTSKQDVSMEMTFDNEVTIKFDPIIENKKNEGDLFLESVFDTRVHILTNLLCIIFRMIHTPDFSLVERFGSNGRACRLFELLIGRLDSNLGRIEGDVLKGVVSQLNLAKNKGFLSASDFKIMMLKLESKSQPNKFDSLLANSRDLLKNNLPVPVSVGTDGAKNRNRNSEWEIPMWELVEDCLHEDMKFPECSVSQQTYQMVELIYSALNLDITTASNNTKAFGNNTTITNNNNTTNYNKNNNNTTTINTTNNNTTTINTTNNNVDNYDDDATTYNDESTLISNLKANNATTLTDNGNISTTTATKFSTKKKLPKMLTESLDEIFNVFSFVRNVAELFMLTRIHALDDDIEKSALVVALHHNDCLYLNHHLLLCEVYLRPTTTNNTTTTLNNTTSKKSKNKESKKSLKENWVRLPCGLSFYDVSVSLEKQATSCLVDFVMGKERWMAECLGEDENLLTNFPQKFTMVTKMLESLKKTWGQVLPQGVFRRSLGAIVNHLVDIITNNFISTVAKILNKKDNMDIKSKENLENKNKENVDLKSKDNPKPRNINLIKKIRTSLTSLHDFCTSLFPNPTPETINNPEAITEMMMKLAPKWRRLEEMRFILEPLQSPRSIINRWGARKEPNVLGGGGGGGGGFGVFTMEERKVLLELVFHGSDREKLLMVFC